MNTRPITFLHRGAPVHVDPVAPTRTVLEWLREDAHCTGTKEGCAEGDCGACTVVVGQLDAAGALQLKPINACIQFLPTLDGKALFTVEDVAAADGTLHPVQQCLVDHHGSQCGFCTPGFVMSLWACYQRHHAAQPSAATVPSRQQLADDLSGNLCRCTGYRPILDAGQRMFDAPAVPLNRAAVVQALQALQPDTPLHCGRPGASLRAPRTLAEFAAWRVALPQARVLAGSTDMGLWVTKQFKDLGDILYIGQVAELQSIDTSASHFHIGAAVTLQDAWHVLAAEWPTLRDVWLRFASLPIRMTGTMGGNVANGSPIGDAAPVLMALGAHIVLQQGDAVRRLPLPDFYLGYMKNALQPGEFVRALEVPRAPRAAHGAAGAAAHQAPHRQHLRVYKISKRFDCDISAVCAALAVEMSGTTVANARLAFGGMAATVQRAAEAEAALQGQPWTEATLQTAMAALAADFTPLSDMRASSGYRMQVAQNLLRRFWLETRPDAPLTEAQVNVWARKEPA